MLTERRARRGVRPAERASQDTTVELAVIRGGRRMNPNPTVIVHGEEAEIEQRVEISAQKQTIGGGVPTTECHGRDVRGLEQFGE